MLFNIHSLDNWIDFETVVCFSDESIGPSQRKVSSVLQVTSQKVVKAIHGFSSDWGITCETVQVIWKHFTYYIIMPIPLFEERRAKRSEICSELTPLWARRPRVRPL